MLLLIVELGEASSLKDKRRTVSAVKEKLRHRYRLSCAEVDLQDSLRFAQIGAALVSNSHDYGEKVLRNAVTFVEDHYDLDVLEVQIHSETYE
ncbi:MAG: DUF503 domain-containing protein [Rectinema sp.]